MIDTFDMMMVLTQVLVAWICWHLFWEWLVYELQRDKYEGLLIASVVEAVLSVFFYVIDVKEVGVGNEDVLANTVIEKTHMIIATGFFMHDTPHWEPKLSLTNVTLFFHHLLSLAILLMVLLHGFCGSFVLEMSTLLELTTPLLLVRYYQRESGYSSKATEISYALLFTFLRFWYGANLTLVILENEDIPAALQVMSFFVFLSSMCLFPGVAKMAITRSRSSPSLARRESEEESSLRVIRTPSRTRRPRRRTSSSKRTIRRLRSASSITIC